jgi:hypothetical protein
MIDPVMFFYAVWFAIITMMLSVLLGYISNPRLRIVLPLVGGMILAFFVTVINPQFSYDLPGLLYYLKLLCTPLVVPLLIVVPLLFIGQITGTRFGKAAVFLGALITIMGYLVLSQSGLISFSAQEWKVESLVWTGCALFISFIAFFMIAGIRCLVSKLQKRRDKIPEEKLNQKKNHAEMKRIVLPVLCLIALCSPFAVLDYSMHSSTTCGAFAINEVSESMTAGNKVIHLTDADFYKFTRMKLVIKEGRYAEETCDNIPYPGITGTCLGSSTYLCSEERTFAEYGNYPRGPDSDSLSVVYLEYNDRFYYLMRTWVT